MPWLGCFWLFQTVKQTCGFRSNFFAAWIVSRKGLLQTTHVMDICLGKSK
jgi:hypothetical protein